MLPSLSLKRFTANASLLAPLSTPTRSHFSTTPNLKLHPACDSTYYPPTGPISYPSVSKYDIIVIGGGHNGLTAASYLAKFAGLKVLVLERRSMLGGCCVTEEVFPGYKFSRASYLAGLLRPKVLEELELRKYPTSGPKLTFLQRNPSSFTPTRADDPEWRGKYLMFWNGGPAESQKTLDSIAQFSVRDAEVFDRYEEHLGRIRKFLQPLLDYGPPPLELTGLLSSGLQRSQMSELLGELRDQQDVVLDLYEILTSPARKILDRWFESQILKTTLATDAVIGSTLSPSDMGSAYVLLHHVMGEIDGNEGVWAYCQGGMGTITNALRDCATAHGVEIVTNARVRNVSLTRENAKSPFATQKSGFGAIADMAGIAGIAGMRGKSGKKSESGVRCNGVILDDGTFVQAEVAVLSNVNPYHTFVDLCGNGADAAQGVQGLQGMQGMQGMQGNEVLPEGFMSEVKGYDYQCGAFKINCVVNGLPNFECCPAEVDELGRIKIGATHTGTVHFESRMHELEDAAMDAKRGIPAERPIIEMTIPSSLDHTLVAPEKKELGHHVVQLFVQHAPYKLNKEHLGVADWDDAGGSFKQIFAERVFNIIEEFVPGFKSSVVHADVLSPRDLEKIFGIYRGNIFHGALSLDQLGYARPAKGYANYETPLEGLYMCGAGAHPGGGVMGACGRNCAKTLMNKLNIKM